MSEHKHVKAEPKSRSRFRTIKRFNGDERGVAAIEFAILAMPFLLVLFAILESSISFASQQLISDTVDRIARDVRVGNIRKGGPGSSPAEISDRICTELEFFVAAGCPDMEIDLKVYATYDDLPVTLPRKPNYDVNTAGFDIEVGEGMEIQMLRVFYRWKYMTKFIADKAATLPDGKTLLYAAAAWKNEPFQN